MIKLEKQLAQLKPFVIMFFALFIFILFIVLLTVVALAVHVVIVVDAFYFFSFILKEDKNNLVD